MYDIKNSRIQLYVILSNYFILQKLNNMEPQVPSTSQEEMKLTELSSRMNIIDRDKYAANKLIAINFKEINF